MFLSLPWLWQPSTTTNTFVTILILKSSCLSNQVIQRRIYYIGVVSGSDKKTNVGLEKSQL